MKTPSVKSQISRLGYDDREASEEGASVNDDDKFVFNWVCERMDVIQIMRIILLAVKKYKKMQDHKEAYVTKILQKRIQNIHFTSKKKVPAPRQAIQVKSSKYCLSRASRHPGWVFEFLLESGAAAGACADASVSSNSPLSRPSRYAG